ncbi:MAG: hypothetical protein H8D96_18460 [Desulfobacterales bacterium]|uniref:Uncharacterized protein n=1 Tax=Candidatus Desulfatibia vada TaxID=2841696 RepID=A0A8J6P196_9BACT|nr:hypothetical protein [Candidatus Desulfatibia vada]
MKSKKIFKERNPDFVGRGLGFIEKGELATAKKDIAEVESILKTMIKSFKSKHLTP